MIAKTFTKTSDKSVKFSKDFSGKGTLTEVSKNEPCRHCGKPDWCYRIGELEVCKRGEPADGWTKTSKHDKEGLYYLTPITHKKQPRPKQARKWRYDDRDNNPLVRVMRTDDGNGNKKIWQEHYQDGSWVKGLGDLKREDIPVYRHREITFARLMKSEVFVTEGEVCADALRALSFFATTNIGGSGKWMDSDSADLTGAKVIICPDGDKPGIKHFIDIYKRHPDAKVLLPYPNSPLWNNLPESGGLDVADWIEKYHLSKDDILNQVMDITPELIQRLEKQLHSQPLLDETVEAESTNQIGRKGKIPKADVMGTILAEDYQDKLAYNNQIGYWMFYELEQPGVWQVITNEAAESIISKELDSREITGYGSHGYIIDILKKLRGILIQLQWNEASALDYLPFQDKVLELKTGKVIQHSPGFRFTWSLPRNYDENANDWSLIESWLDEVTGGKNDLKNIIVCFFNATLKSRYELQKSLFITGHGGTGKTTLQNLLVELIGERNAHTTSLSDFCGNRFETANAYGKRLVIFPDEDKYSGNLQRFKDLTGRGWLKVERKGKDVERKYKYMGMVMMASNFPVFVGEQSSAIKRRLITIPFTQSPSKVDANLFEKLASQLNAFTNYLLSLSDEFVTQTLMDTQECAEVAFMEWEHRMMTDSVAYWLNEHVIIDKNARTQVGSDKDEAEDGGLARVITLFGSYYPRCKSAGRLPKASSEFSRHLLDLCNNILGLKEIRKVRTRDFNAIQGLRLRVAGADDDIPTLEEKFLDLDEMVLVPSTPSTIQAQQGLVPSTLVSTLPSTAPSTGGERGELVSDSTSLINSQWSVETSVETSVEGSVETSNPYQIKIVEGVEGKALFHPQVKNNPFKEGDQTIYCGDDKDWWGEEVLVKQISGKTRVVIGVIGGTGKRKYKECNISDLKPLE